MLKLCNVDSDNSDRFHTKNKKMHKLSLYVSYLYFSKQNQL